MPMPIPMQRDRLTERYCVEWTIDQRSTGSVHLDGALVLVLRVIVRFPVVQFVIV